MPPVEQLPFDRRAADLRAAIVALELPSAAASVPTWVYGRRVLEALEAAWLAGYRTGREEAAHRGTFRGTEQ